MNAIIRTIIFVLPAIYLCNCSAPRAKEATAPPVHRPAHATTQITTTNYNSVTGQSTYMSATSNKNGTMHVTSGSAFLRPGVDPNHASTADFIIIPSNRQNGGTTQSNPKHKGNYINAKRLPGKPGYVMSPYNNKPIDARGIASGTLVADPTYPISEKKYFRVP
jgi:hypothetical protein